MKDDARLQWLWAPWRMPYLKGIHRAKKSACFFCDYARAARKDRPNLVLHRGRTCFIVLNRYPYNTGHLMVAPLAHKAEMGRLGARERAELFELAVVAQKTLDRALRPHGYNLGMNLGRVAGAGIPGHLHLHLVPRWNGDTNFMPVVGRTRVVPQALDDLYSHLQKAMPDSR